MIVPDPALAPVIPPVIVPIVQLKVLATVAVRLMFGLVLLQVVAVAGLVTDGLGKTVTVMVNGVPAHDPTTDVGVTIYSTKPETVELGLTRD